MRKQKRGPALHHKQLAVLGAGRSGLAAARLAKAAGAKVRVLEQSTAVPSPEVQHDLSRQGIQVEQGPHEPGQFRDAELIILSPGIALRSIQPLLPVARELPVFSELEVASWFVDEPIIAVTGSNGKTTTVSLIAGIFEEQGRDIFLGGNIGTPLSEYVLEDRKAEILVLEVSSFQLQHTVTFHPQVAVFLNFCRNHLDYHEHMQNYWQAKLKIFANQTAMDTAILPRTWSEHCFQKHDIQSSRLYFQARKRFQCPGLLGEHNLENIEAAYSACSCFGVQPDQAAQAIKSYTGQAHRQEIVAEIKGVCFVNDSKATTFEAQEAALKSFQAPILLLAGGRIKGGNPGRLAHLVAEKVKAVALFGESREVFEQAWSSSVQTFWQPSLAEAFQELVALSRAGDVLLLSPGTSSFDLFENYEQRGRTFRELVQGLEAE